MSFYRLLFPQDISVKISGLSSKPYEECWTLLCLNISFSQKGSGIGFSLTDVATGHFGIIKATGWVLSILPKTYSMWYWPASLTLLDAWLGISVIPWANIVSVTLVRKTIVVPQTTQEITKKSTRHFTVQNDLTIFLILKDWSHDSSY